ncbi:MAG: precorrin-6y C5,15-methyltransferase (decarboxylating) subunit CbiE [Desulfomonile sp.]|nr:precorrin-6y C5,15-methyltransferase (decarboxylating) subunit CbiE [Desulfomonile sp.]
MASEAPKILIIGCGPGSPDYLTPAAMNAARQADVLIGAARLLDLFRPSAQELIPMGRAIDETLDTIHARLDHDRIAVLVSGDPGLHSLAAAVIRRFGREACSVVPGISSVQAAFAAIGVDWTDVVIISAHKQDPDFAPASLKADKIAVLCGRGGSLTWISDNLLPRLRDHRVFVCENLTLEDEQVREVRPDDLKMLQASSQTVVLIVGRNVLT